MLTSQQARRINRYGLCTLHDYWYTSLACGEPFWEGDTLAYYDGRIATICGFALRDQPDVSDDVLRRLILRWVVDRRAEGIALLGPRPVDLGWLREYGFRLATEDDRNAKSCELFIESTGRPGTIVDRRIYKRSRKVEFEVKIRSGGIISADHMRLIELFYSLRDLTGYLVEVAFSLPALLRSRRVHLIEAWKKNQLYGFLAYHKPFSDMGVGIFLAHDHKTPGICDFLYGEMLDHARRLGVSGINVGPSPSIGHYNFKRKWGGRPIVPPYYYAQWSRGQLSRRSYKIWGARILRL
jgi:hypothetical protein